MTDDRISMPLAPHRASTGIVISILGLAALSWLITIAQMSGMDMGNMGTETDLGSFGHFLPLWVAMMAAMMLPSIAVPLLRRAPTQSELGAVPSFLLTYLAIWAAVGVVAYAAYRPHPTAVAGAIVISAGLYEFTPVKRRCREQCHRNLRSGTGFGIACVGSTVGLMAALLAISPMSIGWMAVITALVVAQKAFPATRITDVPVALIIVGVGGWILIDPSSVPALLPHM